MPFVGDGLGSTRIRSRSCGAVHGGRTHRIPSPQRSSGYCSRSREIAKRVLGIVCATTGLRISEVLGLKWDDIDFADKSMSVLRSYVDGSIGPCKSETSQQAVLLTKSPWRDCWLALHLPLQQERDWTFANEALFGTRPMWPG